MVHYRSWCKSIEIILSGLNSTILVRDPETHDTLVNFDPQVNELMKETAYMKKMNLQVPDEAKNLTILQPKIENHANE